MRTQLKKLAITILAIALAGLLVASQATRTRGQSGSAAHLKVLYLGEPASPILSALTLDHETINCTTGQGENITAPTLANFDAVVINDVNLTAGQIAALKTWTNETDVSGNYRHGITIVMGPLLTQGNDILKELGFTNQTLFQAAHADIKGLSIETRAGVGTTHSLVSGITWNAFPEIVNYTRLPAFALTTGSSELIGMQYVNGTPAGNSLIVTRNVPGNASVGPNIILMAYWLQNAFNDVDHNAQFTSCPYFNYLIFGSVVASTGSTLISYGSWAYSPVPHEMDTIVIGLFVAACTVAAIVFYNRARKKGRELETVQVAARLRVPEKNGMVEGIEVVEVAEKKEDPWKEIGFHRQVSGFVKMFFLIMFLVIPQLVVTSILMPRFLNPYPQAAGWYSFTFHFFEAIWLLFDTGFNFALAKFFAQHRIERPDKAFHYVQLFVWWEIFSGCVQVFLIAFLTGMFLPYTSLAYVSWMFILHSLVQYPGFFLVFQYFFQGEQRADYQMISFVLREFFLRLASQALLVPIFRAIYGPMVMYGEAFGAGVGLILGYQLGDTLLFIITWGMYKGLGLKSSPMFVVQFNREEFKETFKFGIKIAVGESLVPLVWLLQVLLVAELLPNASAEQGYFELAWTIGQITQAVTLLTASMIGALTEAHEYKKKALLNYTSSSGWKWGNIWNVFLCSTLWAIGRTFIIGASGPLWGRAASLLPWLVLFNLLGPISWQADQEFSAANRPGFAGLSWIVEQSIRASFLLILFIVPVMEVVVFGYIVALGIKDAFTWILIRWKVHKWDWNPWPTFIAPALAGVCNFLLMWLLSNVLGETIIDALLLFVVSMFGMVFIYSFFIGFWGGYDKNTLAELDKATNMVTGVKGMTRLYYHMAAAGARISPLHNRFPMKRFDEAMQEAQELTAIKRDIKVVG